MVSNGVMVAQQVLVLFVVVRIRLGQRKWERLVPFFCCFCLHHINLRKLSKRPMVAWLVQEPVSEGCAFRASAHPRVPSADTVLRGIVGRGIKTCPCDSTVHLVVVDGLGLIFAVRRERRLVFFHDFVFTINFE